MRLMFVRFTTFAALALTGIGGLAQASALQPFVARYEVFRDGKSQGEAVMRLEQVGGSRWKFSSEVRGTSGMARLSGFEMSERTEFELLADGGLKPLTASAEGGISLRRRSIVTEFDYARNEVRWSGDAKPDQRGPAPLSERTVNPQILNSRSSCAPAPKVRSGSIWSTAATATRSSTASAPRNRSACRLAPARRSPCSIAAPTRTA
jgi:hypothetical protein